MTSCDWCVCAYKNGKTFDQYRDVAESLNPNFKKIIENHGKVLWTEVLEKVDHNKIVYKLTLKFLRWV